MLAGKSTVNKVFTYEKLLNLEPLSLFSEKKLTTRNGKSLETFVDPHIVSCTIKLQFRSS